MDLELESETTDTGKEEEIESEDTRKKPDGRRFNGRKKGEGRVRLRGIDALDGDLVSLERLLSECGSGWRCQIVRISPSWCDGTLETVNVDPTVPIDIEEIRQSWGGRRLQLVLIDDRGRMRKRINLKFPDPPRNNGQAISPPGAVAVNEAGQALAAPDPGENYRKILELLIKNQESQKTSYAQALEVRLADLERQLNSLRSMPAAAPAPIGAAPQIVPALAQPVPQAVDVIAQVSNMISQVDNLRSAIGRSTPADVAEGGGGSDVLNDAIKQILQIEIEKRRAPAAAPQAQTPAPPMPERRSAGPAPAAGLEHGAGLGALQSGNPIVDEVLRAVKDKLSTMDPARLESILGIVLDDGAIIEEEDDPTDESTADPTAIPAN
jgi:hypothetical protein